MTDGFVKFAENIVKECFPQDHEGKGPIAASTIVTMLEKINPLFVQAANQYEKVCLEASINNASLAQREPYGLQETISGEVLWAASIDCISLISTFGITIRDKIVIDSSIRDGDDRAYIIFEESIKMKCIQIGQSEILQEKLTKIGKNLFKQKPLLNSVKTIKR